MENELYLIYLDDYLNHIGGKLEMYELMLKLVRALRADLEDDSGEFTPAMRTLCDYESQAHELYEKWRIPDKYAKSSDPANLGQLMEDKLLPLDDLDSFEDDGDYSSAGRLLRVVRRLNRSARDLLDVTSEIVEFEEKVDRLLDSLEKPENDCAN